ncbi:MAG TPA: ribonuclease domain-containing protein [Candidatus Limiplasma sp.]|nr:ribonuclease domain-containing protein [Candidatus Limiplasma sp.]
MDRMKRLISMLAACMLVFTAGVAAAKTKAIAVDAADYAVEEGGAYTSMAEVAIYLTLFNRLPDNFITKKQAQALGWNSREGNLNQVAPGKSIGGDYFGNYEGAVPDQKGRQWTECDIDSDGGYRNGLRIVFSNDGLIYYSDDHYQTFTRVSVTVSAAATAATARPAATAYAESAAVTEDGAYTAPEDVAAYLHLYGQLPGNYLTRDEAQALGWSNKKNNLGDVAPGKSIGGDSFGNREGLLPDAKGRQWFECDVNTTDGKRSQERLVWSNDGLIYYTPDNHKSFEQLY